MVENSSQIAEKVPLVQSSPVRRIISMALTQTLVWPLVCITLLMLVTFNSKEIFKTEARYILFSHSLLMGLLFLLLTDLAVLLSFDLVLMPLGACVPLCILTSIAKLTTVLTIVAMCLERYVAICMPLRHNAISTSRRTLMVILLIWLLSSLVAFIELFILVSTASREYLTQVTVCIFDIMVPERMQRFRRGLFHVVGFILIFIIEMFCYVSIILAARAASGDNKKAASKGQRTIALHIIQLFFCTVEILCPYIEAEVLLYDAQAFLNVRFFNFLAFSITSKAVSPLVYGFRDEKFYAALVCFVRCRANHISSETEK